MEQNSLTRFQVARAFVYLLITLQLARCLGDVPMVIASRGQQVLYEARLWDLLNPLVVVVFWPLASLLAQAMVGNQGEARVDSLRALQELWVPCLGIALALTNLPSALFGSIAVLTSKNPLFVTVPTIDSYMPLARCSVGLALTFFPTVRAQVRRIKDNEEAATFP